MKKKCTKCGVVKSETKFNRHTVRSGKGLYRVCQICQDKNQAILLRRGNLRRNYGITLEQYNAMFAAQNGLCAICGQPEIVLRQGKLLSLAVDHNRETEKVRALLCCNCNQGLGKFKHNSERLEKAATYLRYHEKTSQ